MSVEKIPVKQFLELAKHHPVLDVRSPGEYRHAHIPGAVSFPLFSDEERKQVGIIYKKQSREQAIKTGLDFFGPKMRRMVEEAELILKNQKGKDSNKDHEENSGSRTLLVHCWRGGMRSAAIAWLLDLYGYKIYTLAGGYKKYRNEVLESFKLPYNFKILGGYTGSGKTEILKALKAKGEKIIDLEGIANHKGSAFGNIGLPRQPGQEMFENLLHAELSNLSASIQTDKTKSIWLEDESQRIGIVNIPKDLWNNMRRSPLIFIDIPFEKRLHHICEEYGQLDQEKITDAISRISKKLGDLNAKSAILMLKEGKIHESFAILLRYYDKHYLKSLHNREDLNSLLHTVVFDSVTPENTNLLATKIEYQTENH